MCVDLTFLPVFSTEKDAKAAPSTCTAPKAIACWLGVRTMLDPSEAFRKISPAKFITGLVPHTSRDKANIMAIVKALIRILSCTVNKKLVE